MSNQHNSSKDKTIEDEDLISKCEQHADELVKLLDANKGVSPNNVRAATAYLRTSTLACLSNAGIKLL